jgi:subtilase family protein
MQDPKTARGAGKRNGGDDRIPYRRRVVLKVHDHVGAPPAASEKAVGPEIAAVLARVQERYPGAKVEPLFSSVSSEELRKLTETAVERDPTYEPPNLSAYAALELPLEAQADSVAKEIASWDAIELAYVEGGPVQPPVNAVDDPRQVNQGYEDSAPSGINAEYAWTFAGGDGQSVGFVDMEQGWTLNHEDLVGAAVSLISGDNHNYWGHGTGVLGEVVAVDNTKGDVGIAPSATARVISQWRTSATFNTADTIVAAAAAMAFGDVLLLEAQTNYGGYSLVPVEVEPAVFDAIRLTTALGIVVVEAAGNGGNNLDNYMDGGNKVLNRTDPSFKDSGAIMVGAASSTAPHSRLSFSNFGSRIDCYAWGENVDTTGNGTLFDTSTTTYTTAFNGTSSASPIIAGAALAVQGIASQSPSIGFRFSPWQLRDILADPTTGTASNVPAIDLIGVMPNLKKIVDSVLNVAQDIYIRDFVGDAGDPHTGAVSASPDIILRQSAVSNPQAAFGQGSGTENDNTLGYEAEAGQDNYIYVRVRNRGGSTATNVQATIYWSEVATLVTPNLWHVVGTVTIPNVPTGDVLTVSDALVWQSASIPATGHYCFVGLIGTPVDPAPGPADFLNWNNFVTFIRVNNNVTWRNFNVVNNVPPSKGGGGVPPGFVALPFLAPGPPDQARRMALEVIARLPEGAKVLLEAPLYLLDALHLRPPHRKTGKSGMGQIPLKAHGKHPLGEALFPAESKARLRLLVQIPEGLREHPYEIAVRQLYLGEEVGRVTWRLAPPRKEIG